MAEAQVVGYGQAAQVGADDLAAAPVPLPAATGLAGLFKRPAARWARAIGQSSTSSPGPHAPRGGPVRTESC